MANTYMRARQAYRKNGARCTGPLIPSLRTVFHTLTDAQFSVVAILGPGVSAPADRIGYSPYGIATFRTAADVNGWNGADMKDTEVVTSYAGIEITKSDYNADYDMNRDGVINADDANFVYSQEGTGAAVKAGCLGDNRAAAGGPRLDIGYCGHVFNEETSLYTVRFRDYSPLLGRWLEQEPATSVNKTNLSSYAESARLGSGIIIKPCIAGWRIWSLRPVGSGQHHPSATSRKITS